MAAVPCVRKETIVKLLDPEREGTAVFRNVGKCWPIDTVSQPRRIESSVSEKFFICMFSISLWPLAQPTSAPFVCSEPWQCGCTPSVCSNPCHYAQCISALHYKHRVIPILMFTAVLQIAGLMQTASLNTYQLPKCRE